MCMDVSRATQKTDTNAVTQVAVFLAALDTVNSTIPDAINAELE
jgi:hypothetical protein